MFWIELSSWIVVGVVLASLHVFAPKVRPEAPVFIFAAVLIGAIFGGLAIGVLARAPFVVGGYSFGKLLGALVFAEIGAMLARKPPHTARPT